MPKHKTCDRNTSSNSSTEDSDDEGLNAKISEAVDPVLHKSLYDKSNFSEDKELKSQGKYILIKFKGWNTMLKASHF